MDCSTTSDQILASKYYIDILEKTNQQLNLWYTPYSLSITILTALVAFLALFFAYILWKQGKEYKDAFNGFIEEQRRVAEQEREQIRIDTNERLDKTIFEATQRLESVEGGAKASLEKSIDDLKKLQNDLALQRPSYAPTIVSSVFDTQARPIDYTKTYPINLTTLNPDNFSPLIKTVSSINYEKLQRDLNNMQEQIRKLGAEMEKKISGITKR